jgi:hypothetical protein
MISFRIELRRICGATLLQLVRVLYGRDDADTYVTYYGVPTRTLLRMGFLQKVLGFNRSVPWPVHFTSMVAYPERIQRPAGHSTLGWMPGCYIQAMNGICSGVGVFVGPGAKIISANHQIDDLARHQVEVPIRIEDHCWIGANAIILPGVHLGPRTVVGAGAVVTKSVPEGNCVIAGNPARIVRTL